MRKGAALLLAFAAPALAIAEPAAEPAETVVYLVRHAEKEVGEAASADPPLTEAGVARAAELVRVLRAEGITHVFSTPFRRCTETARPLAGHFGLGIEEYDPHALEAFAERLRSLPGRHVVVGHSNTTPRLVELLGGEPGDAIDETLEHDRLYVVVLRGADPPTTLSLRYGR